MNIDNLGLVKISRLRKKRFIELPYRQKKNTRSMTLSVIRFPSMALYTLPANATAYYKEVISRKPRDCVREHQNYLRILYDSAREAVLEPGKPLEIPSWLIADKAGNVGCLKISNGLAILALYTPDNLTKVLSMLSMSFGKIVYKDEAMPWNMSIRVEKPKKIKTEIPAHRLYFYHSEQKRSLHE